MTQPDYDIDLLANNEPLLEIVTTMAYSSDKRGCSYRLHIFEGFLEKTITVLNFVGNIGIKFYVERSASVEADDFFNNPQNDFDIKYFEIMKENVNKYLSSKKQQEFHFDLKMCEDLKIDLKQDFIRYHSLYAEYVDREKILKIFDMLPTLLSKYNMSYSVVKECFKEYLKERKNRAKILINLKEFSNICSKYSSEPFILLGIILLYAKHNNYKIAEIDKSLDYLILTRFQPQRFEYIEIDSTTQYKLILEKGRHFEVTLIIPDKEPRTCYLKPAQYQFLETLYEETQQVPQKSGVYYVKLFEALKPKLNEKIKGRPAKRHPSIDKLSGMAKALRFELKHGLSLNNKCENETFFVYYNGKNYFIQENVKIEIRA